MAVFNASTYPSVSELPIPPNLTGTEKESFDLKVLLKKFEKHTVALLGMVPMVPRNHSIFPMVMRNHLFFSKISRKLSNYRQFLSDFG